MSEKDDKVAYNNLVEIKTARRRGRPMLPEEKRLVRYQICVPADVALWAYDAGAEKVRAVLRKGMEGDL